MSQQEPTIADWLRQGEERSLEHHIIDRASAHNHAYDDISALELRTFHSEGPPDGDWRTYIPADPVFCKVGFPDGIALSLWWSREQQAPLTYQQARQLLKGGSGPLDFATQQFLENYSEPTTTTPDFAADTASVKAAAQKAAGPADCLD